MRGGCRPGPPRGLGPPTLPAIRRSSSGHVSRLHSGDPATAGLRDRRGQKQVGVTADYTGHQPPSVSQDGTGLRLEGAV